MIKITSGIYRSRNIEVPSYLEVPTKSIVRQGVTNALRIYLEGVTALDVFSGSGVMGLEFYSNGAKKVVFNDINSESKRIIEKNLKSLGIENAEVYNHSYDQLLKVLSEKQQRFDVIFVDPPYKMVDSYEEIINFVVNNNLLTDTGIIILEYEGKLHFENAYFKKIKTYKYGRTKVCVMWR